jgi:hypothetical protein
MPREDVDVSRRIVAATVEQVSHGSETPWIPVQKAPATPGWLLLIVLEKVQRRWRYDQSNSRFNDPTS